MLTQYRISAARREGVEVGGVFVEEEGEVLPLLFGEVLVDEPVEACEFLYVVIRGLLYCHPH
jgi:hypothetical protein